MKVSIITVSYNSEKTIQDTISSVLNQSYTDIEYIIIDGGSNDKTAEIVRKYGNKISKFVSEKDSGIYDAMNKGIKIATGEVIGTLNADDLYANTQVVSEVVSAMSKNEADVCWGDLVYVKSDDLNKIIRNWKSSDYGVGKFKNGWHPPHPTFFVKKEIYKKYGYFDQQFKIAADYELMLRFLEKYKVRSCYIPSVLVKMRLGGVSNRNLKNIMQANLESYKAWQVNGLKVNPLRIILKPLSKLGQYFK